MDANNRIAYLYGKIWSVCDVADLDELLDLTEQAGFASGELSAKKSPWISVEERFPEEFKEVFVKYNVYGEVKCDVLFIYGSVEWCFADQEEYIDENMIVTHWMPIPE